MNFIEISAFDLYENYITQAKMHDLVCPNCNSIHSCQYHASYDRILISYENNSVIDYSITVTRVICSSCGKTRSLLPFLIIPHGSYSLFFILAVLRDYYTSTKIKEQICDQYGISISTLYAWIKLFLTHKSLWLSVLEDICVSPNDFLTLLIYTNDFVLELKRFFQTYTVSFLQGVSKTSSSHLP